MSDIVEWLRSGGEFEDGQRAPHTTMHKAADEIERLRAERDELRNTLNCIPNSILKAQAEIERLRSEKAELLKKRNSEEMQRMIYYWGRRAENAEDERAELLAALQEIEFHGGPAADYARAAIAKVEGK
jgi:predicted RNase H-like nuclease (RuvC/YqgF family)